MRRQLLVLLASFAVACGSPSPAVSPTPSPSAISSTPAPSAAPTASASAAPSASASVPLTTAPPPGAKLMATITAPPGGEAFGPAFSRDGASVVYVVADRIHRFDPVFLGVVDARPVTRIPRLTMANALVLHGQNDVAVDVATGSRIVVDVPKGYDCSDAAFSADGGRVSRNCTLKGDELVLVQDTRTGATIATLKEFQTAAPSAPG